MKNRTAHKATKSDKKTANAGTVTYPSKLDTTSSYHLKSILIIMITSISIYANTLGNGFVHDDRITIVDNTFIKDVTNLPKLFTKEYFDGSNELTYRPVVTATYFLEYCLFEHKPWGYHLISILIHAINGTLLYIFLTLLMRLRQTTAINHRFVASLLSNPPLMISLLFVTHPAITEAVNAISYREDLLAFLFFMTSLSLYIALRTNFSHINKSFSSRLLVYGASCTSYFLALLSKEMAVTLPLIIYCYEWVYRKKKAGWPLTLLNPFSIGYIVIMLAYLYIRFYHFYNPLEEKAIVPPTFYRLLTIPWLLLSYIKLMVFPVSLSADYVVPATSSISSLSFICPLIAVILFIVLSFNSKKKEITFGSLFFILTLLPVYNIVPIGNPFAERYLYLPVAGLSIAAGFAISSLKVRGAEPRKLSLYLPLILFIIVATYSLNIVKRNSVWENEYSLWSDTVKKMPNSSRANYNLGNAYDKLGNLDKGIQHYRAALKLNPAYVEAHNNLGVALYKMGQLDEAIQEYEIVLRQKPGHIKTYNNLGLVYAKQGRFDEAIQYYQAALKLDPNFAEVHYNLGLVYLKKGLIDQARMEFEITLKLKPGHLKAQRQLNLLLRRGPNHL